MYNVFKEDRKAEERKQRTVKNIIKIVIAVVIFNLLLFNSIYSINEQEQGVLTTFGKADGIVTSGLHFKVPFIQHVSKVDTTILGFAIGYTEPADQEYVTNEAESLMITSDFNFVDVDFYVEYKVSDPVKYLYNSEEPENILKNIAQSCIRTVVSNYTVDDVITTGKSEIQASIREMIVEKLETLDIGLTLVNISMQDAEPPTTEVMEAFKAVETAKQGKETAVNNANKYKNEQIPLAEAEADQIIQAAEAEKQERINEATAQVVRFSEMYEEYVKNPLITKQRIFYETMEDVLPEVELIIDDGSGNLNKTLYLDELDINDITNNSAADNNEEEE